MRYVDTASSLADLVGRGPSAMRARLRGRTVETIFLARHPRLYLAVSLASARVSRISASTRLPMDWRSLFPSTTPAPQTVESCAALRGLLLDAFGPFTGENQHDAAIHFLRSAGADGWVNIDQRLRGYSGIAYDKWQPGTLNSILSCPLSDEERQSLLFVACSHRDGRERQKALWRVREAPGLLTLVAALIRSADWVPEVRYAARDAVPHLLRMCAVDDVLAAWPIVLRLQHWERSTDGWLAEVVEGWILDSEHHALLSRARASANPAVRVWAYRKSIENGEAVLLRHALMQPDPRIGLHALRHAQATLDGDSVAALAASGLDAPHPVVRRECLRALALTDHGSAVAALPRALLDRSAGVRRLAAYLTRKNGSDARVAWRAALDGSSARFAIGALASLAEDAEAEDATRMRRLLFSARSTVRQYALKGLLRTGQSLSPEEVSHLLQLGGSRVVATLASAVADSAVPLDVDTILFVLADQSTRSEGRTNLRRLLEAGGLWSCLERILALRVREADRQWWLASVDDWISRSEYYAPLGDMRKSTLLRATAERAEELGHARLEMIESALHRY